MSYTQFETENANYTLVGARHFQPTELDFEDIGGIDAIVLEIPQTNLYHTDFERTIETHRGSRNPHSPFEVFEQCMKRQTPVYCVDVIPEDAKSKYDNLSSLEKLRFFSGGILSIPFCMIEKNKNERIGSWFPRAIDLTHKIEPGNSVDYRNAVTAEKTEKYVAPALQEQLKKKPNIMLYYGNGHMAMKYDFLDANRKIKTLNKFFRNGIGEKTLDHLNITRKFVYENNLWRSEVLDTPILNEPKNNIQSKNLESMKRELLKANDYKTLNSWAWNTMFVTGAFGLVNLISADKPIYDYTKLEPYLLALVTGGVVTLLNNRDDRKRLEKSKK